MAGCLQPRSPAYAPWRDGSVGKAIVGRPPRPISGVCGIGHRPVAAADNDQVVPVRKNPIKRPGQVCPGQHVVQK
jgi:hypothetical protein